MVNRIYFDLVGGWSGDRFISGMLVALPQFRKGIEQVIVNAG